MNNNQALNNKYKCPICGNTESKYIGIRNNHPYCRKCLTFRGREASGNYLQSESAEYILHYELTDDQKRLSKQLIQNYKDNKDSLVHAVCGSGKTEIVLEVIKFAISSGHRVGFAVPRRDVVRELYLRFKGIFTKNKVCVVYGGHTNVLEADLVCITTHQLFRYKDYFDLLILDEVDAFPFKGDELLNTLFKRAVKGHFIMMSATPPKEVIDEFKKPNKEILRLDTRFHGHPLPVPVIKKHLGIMKYYQLTQDLRRFSMQNKPIFVFTPTIEICERVHAVMRFLFKDVRFVHSKCPDREQIIDDFRKRKFNILITTAVLERGVTVKDLQVIAFNADHVLYTSAALIQIAGRAGRKKDCPTGEVIFIGSKKTNEMETAIAEIERANKSLQNML